MNNEQEFSERILKIVASDPRYAVDAYTFIKEAVTYAVKLHHSSSRSSMHISGQELLAGIKQFALEQYGPMAIDVFDAWGIHCTRDFGNIVFTMINHRLLGASEDDRIEDFEDVYDFNDVFVEHFRPSGKSVDIPTIA